MVYKLVQKYKEDGVLAYKALRSGRPKLRLNKKFVDRVIEIRKSSDYGKEKIQFVLKRDGFTISQHIVQCVLDEAGLTDPCPKRRGQRKYVRYQWPISNYMWHCDWSKYKGKWYIAFIDDRSRKIMAEGCFDHATEDNAIFVLYQAILIHQVCPVIVLSDKGTQFYNSTPNKKGGLTPSRFEQELMKVRR